LLYPSLVLLMALFLTATSFFFLAVTGIFFLVGVGDVALDSCQAVCNVALADSVFYRDKPGFSALLHSIFHTVEH